MKRQSPKYYIYGITFTLLTLLVFPSEAEAATARHDLFHLLFTDADGSGDLTCGDTVNFVAQIGSVIEGEDLEDTVWELTLPPNASVVPGSVIPGNPNDLTEVVTGQRAGDRRIEVRLGRVCRSAGCTQFGATVQFRLTLNDPNALDALTVQAFVSGSNLSSTPSDALGTLPEGDATVLPYPACPAGTDPPPAGVARLTAVKSDELVADRDGDGLADGGEVLRYRVLIRSVGTATAFGVRYRVDFRPLTALIPGSVVTSDGVVFRGNQAGDTAIEVAFGDLVPVSAVSLTYDVLLASQIPPGVDRVSCQGEASAGNVAGVLTDDLSTPELADPTVTLLDFDPDLILSKDDGGVSVGPGGIVRSTLAWTNASRSPATGVVLTDTVPAEARADLAASSPGWTCVPDAGPGSVCRLGLGSVAPGASGEAVFAFRPVEPLPAGVTALLNQASIGDDGSHGTDLDPANNLASDVTPLTGFRADLAVEKTDEGASVEPGGTVVYRLFYRNLGRREASGVVLTETVPAETRFAPEASSPGWSCSGGGGPGATCRKTVGRLAGGGASGEASFAVTLDSLVPAGLEAIENTVRIADDGAGGADLNPANNTATETTPLTGAMPDLTLAKALDPASDPRPGGHLAFALRYANVGNQDAVGVVLTETIPPHTVFRPADSDPRWSCSATGPGGACRLPLGTLPAGESGSVAFALTLAASLPPGADEVLNCASLGGVEGCARVPLPEAVPDLAVTKDDGGVSALPGEVVAYTLRVTNRGNQGATGVTLTDTLPAGTVFVAEGSSPGWSCSPGGSSQVCTLELGALSAGASRTVTLVLRAPDEPGLLTNRAEVADDGENGPDPNPADNQASDTTPVDEPPPPLPPALEVTLVDEPVDSWADGRVGPGDTVVYLVRVTHAGGPAAADVRFAASPDPHTRLLVGSVRTDRGQVTTGNGAGATRVVVALGDLAPGESVDLAFEVEIEEDLPGELQEISVQGLATAGNAASEPSDDPDTPEDDDPTRTPLEEVTGGEPVDVPTVSEVGALLLALLLAAGAVVHLRRRSPLGPTV